MGVTFVGLAKARFARYGRANKVTPTKVSSSLEPRRPILDRSMKNPLVSIDKWTCHCPMEGGVAKKSRRGNVKGSGICPPPLCTYIVFQIVLKNSLSYKKSAFSLQTVKKQNFFFHVFEKIVLFWSLMASFKAFASLRLQSEAIRGQKNTFTLMKKSITVFGPFLERKILFLHFWPFFVTIFRVFESPWGN